jgi:hypothetical protein
MVRSKGQLRACQRVTECSALLAYRYGQRVPNTATGFLDLAAALATVMQRGYASAQAKEKWVGAWLAQYAKDWPERSREDVVRQAARFIEPWGDKAAGVALGLTWIERAALRIRTIAAWDVSPAEAKQRAKKLRTECQRERRRREGVVTRAVYEARSLAKAEPWLAEGVSRRTWFRRRKRGENGSNTI